VVFASSRTVLELTKLFARWDWAGDLIAENGAQIAVRDPAAGHRLGAQTSLVTPVGEYFILGTGDPLELVRERARRAAREAGLDLDRVVHDSARASSLLLYRTILSELDTNSLRVALTRSGLNIADGGDWLSAWSGWDKGQAATRYLEALGHQGPGSLGVVSIGNAENDIPLLAVASRAFVIRSPGTGHHPSLARIPGANLLEAVGPAGWLEMLERLEAEPA
jgi:hypothetical protein